MIKVEETMNEMRYEKSSFLNKEWYCFLTSSQNI